ncbi:GNAT family N-acetyltransferase [Lichenifustis flavocetrariae]|uniref:GNAT family N-acetyltransferase n=1 Tax=Lichenifustis flavocetrariae TaxID=2949735 RepID=A0AA42CH17_9HYPH|nr:GNAT family N-acetyltransferase [Lichenifustis flavocetrariae]MCW6506799.1 GNAT family N-acetyltransferase [Lichenifustis flavocetrariae]
MTAIRTPRLLLRRWRPEDLPAYAALNADPEVRRWWSAGVLTRRQSDAQAAKLQAHIEAHGFGFWAVEAPGVAPFVGFVGLQYVDAHLPVGPAVEAGWRLARSFWGLGYATEAAGAAVEYGFDRLGFREILAYAVAGNLPSRRVMERIGMRHDPDADFHHPDRPDDDPKRRHVVYRLVRNRPV